MTPFDPVEYERALVLSRAGFATGGVVESAPVVGEGFSPADFRIHLAQERLDLSWANIIFDPKKHPRLAGRFIQSFSAGDTHVLSHKVGSTRLEYHIEGPKDQHTVTHVVVNARGERNSSVVGRGLKSSDVLDKIANHDGGPAKPEPKATPTAQDHRDLTREQEATQERLATEHGRVHVGMTSPHGPAGTREMTVPGGHSYHVSPGGSVVKEGVNHSVHWGYHGDEKPPPPSQEEHHFGILSHIYYNGAPPEHGVDTTASDAEIRHHMEQLRQQGHLDNAGNMTDQGERHMNALGKKYDPGVEHGSATAGITKGSEINYRKPNEPRFQVIRPSSYTPETGTTYRHRVIDMEHGAAYRGFSGDTHATRQSAKAHADQLNANPPAGPLPEKSTAEVSKDLKTGLAKLSPSQRAAQRERDRANKRITQGNLRANRSSAPTPTLTAGSLKEGESALHPGHSGVEVEKTGTTPTGLAILKSKATGHTFTSHPSTPLVSKPSNRSVVSQLESAGVSAQTAKSETGNVQGGIPVRSVKETRALGADVKKGDTLMFKLGSVTHAGVVTQPHVSGGHRVKSEGVSMHVAYHQVKKHLPQ